jgi:MSHA biogenesis protein MshN
MLKDLDQRQTDKTSEPISNAVPVASNHTSKKVILVGLMAVVLLNVVGLLFWQLYSENQSLKSLQNDNLKPAFLTEIKNVEMKNADIKNTETKENKITTIVYASNVAEPAIKVDQGSVNVPVLKAETTVQKTSQQNNQNVVDRNNNIAASDNRASTNRASTNRTNVTPSLPKNHSSNNKKSDNQPLRNPVVLLKDTPASSLTISRRKMSPQDLAKQKFARAKQALVDKEITQAERLFEEILLLLPDHKLARKQLAALWFGRQSYQAALNLLSQGIALSPQDSEYRLMQARIYLSQGQGEKALQTLIVLADSANVEYQALLANTAQQQGQLLSAITAYQQLTKLQVNKGRWWLGLAIAFDSNSQFVKAEQAYQTAISHQNLSNSSAEFARKRIIELGE